MIDAEPRGNSRIHPRFVTESLRSSAQFFAFQFFLLVSGVVRPLNLILALLHSSSCFTCSQLYTSNFFSLSLVPARLSFLLALPKAVSAAAGVDIASRHRREKREKVISQQLGAVAIALHCIGLERFGHCWRAAVRASASEIRVSQAHPSVRHFSSLSSAPSIRPSLSRHSCLANLFLFAF